MQLPCAASSAAKRLTVTKTTWLRGHNVEIILSVPELFARTNNRVILVCDLSNFDRESVNVSMSAVSAILWRKTASMSKIINCARIKQHGNLTNYKFTRHNFDDIKIFFCIYHALFVHADNFFSRERKSGFLNLLLFSQQELCSLSHVHSRH